MYRIAFLVSVLTCLVGTGFILSCSAPEVLAPPPTRTPDPVYLDQAAPEIVKRSHLVQSQGEVETTNPPEAVPTPEPTPVPASVPAVCVTIDSEYGVNVRGGPGTTFAVLGFVENQAQFPLVEENPSSSWYRIRLTDGTGDDTWVSADLAQLGPCAN